MIFSKVERRLGVLRDGLLSVAVDVNPGRIYGADLYYRPDTDTLLIGLRLDLRITTQGLIDRIRFAVERLEGTVLDLQRLSDDERGQFYGSYLSLYGVHVRDLPGVDDALHVLGQRLGRVPPRQPRSAPPMMPIQVKFRRGDRWQSARARGLTREGVYLSTATPPIAGATVAIQLSVGAAKLVANGTVLHVTPADVGAVLGARGFGVRFHVRTPEQAADMDALLGAARGTDLVSPQAPPRRRESRYPVNLPVLVWTSKTQTELAVLDVSRHGIFVAAADAPAPDSAEVAIALPVDGESAPIQAAVRVARTVNDRVARARGISAGVGLEIVSFSPESEKAYQRFVERVSRRVDRTVLIGASPGRLHELTAALTACGYTAAGASDPRTLMERAVGGGRAPDLVVLDDSMPMGHDHAGRSTWQLLQRHGLKTLLLDGDSPGFSRERVDAMLIGEQSRRTPTSTGAAAR